MHTFTRTRLNYVVYMLCNGGAVLYMPHYFRYFFNGFGLFISIACFDTFPNTACVKPTLLLDKMAAVCMMHIRYLNAVE